MGRRLLLGLCLVLLVACGGDDDDAPSGRTAEGPAPNWPAPPDPLARTVAAGLQPDVKERLTFHVHAHLDVFFNGRKVVVPGAIGINTADPGVKRFDEPGGPQYGGIEECAQPCISSLHTHGPDGILHTEAADDEPNTLGQFFTEWGVRLDANCVGDYCAPTTDIAIYVNGERFRGDPAGIELTDRKQIAIVIGRAPEKIPDKADFSRA